MKELKEFLWALSGHQKELIAQSRVDGYRASVIGAILLMVGVYAALAWTLFFSTVMNNTVMAAVCGCFAGIFILLFDRALICSLSSGKKNFGALSFRLALALLLGVFLAQPIVLKLYESDIKREASILIDKKIEERKIELEAIYGSEIKTLTERKNTMLTDLEQRRNQLNSNESSFMHEMDGSAGTGRYGYSTVSQKKESVYQKNVQEYDRLLSSSTPELKRTESRLDTIQKSINTELASYKDQNQGVGFLVQTEALQSLISKDKTNTLRNRYVLLMIILTLVELSALLSKLILETKSYSSRVDFELEHEAKLIEVDREISLSKLDLYKKLTVERETKVIEEFFEKTEATKDEKMSQIVAEWKGSDGQTYKDAWEDLKRKLSIHSLN